MRLDKSICGVMWQSLMLRLLNPTASRKVKIGCNFDLSECNRVSIGTRDGKQSQKQQKQIQAFTQNTDQ